MKTFHLKEKTNHLDEIYINTSKGVYKGTGTFVPKGFSQIYRKPTGEELEQESCITAMGYCSNPYIADGDILVYETDTSEPIYFVFTNLQYMHSYQYNNDDMFRSNLIYLGNKLPQYLKPKHEATVTDVIWAVLSLIAGAFIAYYISNILKFHL